MVGKFTLFGATFWSCIVAHPTDYARRVRVRLATWSATVVDVVVVVVVVSVFVVVIVVVLLVRMFGV